MNVHTIVYTVKNGLCTGCGTCIALCPKEAIELKLNKKKGVYIPTLDITKCNNCGICLKVCPGHEVNFKELNHEVFDYFSENNTMIGNHLKCYVGYSNDYMIRYNSTSGGLVTQLLIFALQEGIIDGALVIRMNKDKPLEPIPFIARTKEEILDAKGSKYCPVPANIALKEILNSKEGERFAVVGLPCHIQGIRKAETLNKKLKAKIIFHCGIVCNHAPTFLATQFLLNMKKIEESNIKKIDYRGEGWPGAMKISFKNGESLRLDGYWGTGFGQRFLPIRCTLCCDHTAELSDVSFADAWIPEIQKNDDIGTSTIIIRNKLLDSLFEQMVSERLISLKVIDSGKIIGSQFENINFKKNLLNARVIFLKWLRRKGPNYALELPSPSLMQYIAAAKLYMRLYFSSKRCLWRLLSIHHTFLRKVSDLVRRI